MSSWGSQEEEAKAPEDSKINQKKPRIRLTCLYVPHWSCVSTYSLVPMYSISLNPNQCNPNLTHQKYLLNFQSQYIHLQRNSSFLCLPPISYIITKGFQYIMWYFSKIYSPNSVVLGKFHHLSFCSKKVLSLSHMEWRSRRYRQYQLCFLFCALNFFSFILLIHEG